MTIDDEIDRILRRIAATQRIKYHEVINRALAKGIESLEAHEAAPIYKVQARDYGFQTAVDQEKLNQLVDELETET